VIVNEKSMPFFKTFISASGVTSFLFYCSLLYIKNALHCPKKPIVFTQKLKKLFGMIDCQVSLQLLPDPDFCQIALFGGNLGKAGIVEFSSSRNLSVSLLLAHGAVGNCRICKS
jgi:hypothetical protein